ncbi:MAG: hypothetical protein ACKO34_01330 [Vampirovibrionales bacterium]
MCQTNDTLLHPDVKQWLKLPYTQAALLLVIQALGQFLESLLVNLCSGVNNKELYQLALIKTLDTKIDDVTTDPLAERKKLYAFLGITEKEREQRLKQLLQEKLNYNLKNLINLNDPFKLPERNLLPLEEASMIDIPKTKSVDIYDQTIQTFLKNIDFCLNETTGIKKGLLGIVRDDYFVDMQAFCSETQPFTAQKAHLLTQSNLFYCRLDSLRTLRNYLKHPDDKTLKKQTLTDCLYLMFRLVPFQLLQGVEDSLKVKEVATESEEIKQLLKEIDRYRQDAKQAIRSTFNLDTAKEERRERFKTHHRLTPIERRNQQLKDSKLKERRQKRQAILFRWWGYLNSYDEASTPTHSYRLSRGIRHALFMTAPNLYKAQKLLGLATHKGLAFQDSVEPFYYVSFKLQIELVAYTIELSQVMALLEIAEKNKNNKFLTLSTNCTLMQIIQRFDNLNQTALIPFEKEIRNPLAHGTLFWQLEGHTLEIIITELLKVTQALQTECKQRQTEYAKTQLLTEAEFKKQWKAVQTKVENLKNIKSLNKTEGKIGNWVNATKNDGWIEKAFNAPAKHVHLATLQHHLKNAWCVPESEKQCLTIQELIEPLANHYGALHTQNSQQLLLKLKKQKQQLLQNCKNLLKRQRTVNVIHEQKNKEHEQQHRQRSTLKNYLKRYELCRLKRSDAQGRYKKALVVIEKLKTNHAPEPTLDRNRPLRRCYAKWQRQLAKAQC